jgi:hypothetical protein
MRRRARFAAVLAAIGAAACAPKPAPQASASAPPKPTVTPQNPQENPEDIRARMPFRPTPLDRESKFPPPQQSAEEEARTSNQPAEPELLHGEPAVLLDGKPFPERIPYEPALPKPRRIRYAAADAKDAGDGTLEHPWKDLQVALCALEPGDRLVVAAGIYAGSFRIGGPCRSGTAEDPIQVFARHAFLKSSGSGDVLTVERAHWQFWEVQIALLDSESAGFVTRGPDAHDIHVDQSHIYEGKGPAVRVAAGSSRITLSNCHIHQSMGVHIDAGASQVRLVNDHIHHNRSASVTIGGGDASEPASGITITGSRIHNDRGPAFRLSHCSGVTVTRTRMSNYRPDEDDKTGGEAIVVGSGCRDVTFSENSVLEASTAVRLEAGSGPASEGTTFRRNFLSNRLTSDSVGFVVDGGTGAKIVNNVIDHYQDPFRIAAAGASGLVVANNLVIDPAIAFVLAAPRSALLFDYNVFGSSNPLPARIGTTEVVARTWMKAEMPHSRVVSGLELEGNDLGKVVGFSPVDAGKAVDGIPFNGAAPDIGVAEH